MKAAVALVIALIIPIFHCGACQRASGGEVPRGSLHRQNSVGRRTAPAGAFRGQPPRKRRLLGRDGMTKRYEKSPANRPGFLNGAKSISRPQGGRGPHESLRSKILWGEGAAAERARRWLKISRRKRCTACVFAALRAAGAPAEVCIGKIPRGEGGMMERYEKSPANRPGFLNGAQSIPTWCG